MILAFIETRALAVFDSPQFLELSESMVQLIMNRKFTSESCPFPPVVFH
jgi:hypothetical protein